MPAYDENNKVLWDNRYDLDFFKERERNGNKIVPSIILM